MLRGAIFVALLSLLTYGVVRYLAFMDAFNGHHNHYPGICKRVKGARHGSEDIAWTNDGLAFITTGLSHPDTEEHFKATGTHGEIQLFDFKNPSAGVTNLRIIAGKGFDVSKMRPHGLDILEDKVKNQHLLYVVNHQYGQALEQVEKFRFDPKARQLTHLRTIVLAETASINDVSAVSEDQFYVTNFMLYKDNLPLTALQFLVPMKVGGLFFYDGAKAVEVATGLMTPNGHCLSKDKKFLYVASTLDETVLVFKRDSDTNKLKLVQTVFIATKADNINLSQKADALLLGAHPVFYKLLTSTASPLAPDSTSASSVLRLPLGKDGLVVESSITELFYDKGDLISQSSAAAAFDKQLLIGSILNSLVHCELTQEI